MRLNRVFFERDVLEVAPDLLGKSIEVKSIFTTGVDKLGMVTEVEAYRGEEDLASHARFGKTQRNAVMYERGGLIYMYLVYGMHWMLNIVTGRVGEPQAVLIRGIYLLNAKTQMPNVKSMSKLKNQKGNLITGPGRVTKYLGLDRSFYGEDLAISKRIWFETDQWLEGQMAIWLGNRRIKQTPRIGVGYAGKWAKKPWRWVIG
jgi:DNA-3-methyladenine glycosylase